MITDDREQRHLVVSVLVEVSRGMTAERMLEYFGYLRPRLEKVCMGAEDDDMFSIVRVDVPGWNLALSPSVGEAPKSDAVRLSPDAETKELI